MVVVTADPASITDAYALIKVMFLNHRMSHFDVVINQAKNEKEAKDVYRTLSRVADKYLHVGLNFAGFIPADPLLVQSVRKQGLVSEMFPESPSARSFHELSGNVMRLWRRERHDDGRMIFFWRRLLEESPPELQL